MASVFTMIIDGKFPGRFVWQDDVAVAFLSINPLAHGHVLVVPRVEVDHWLDLDDDTWRHVGDVTKRIGEALQEAFAAPRVGTIIAGFEVPHVHVHVFPATDLRTFDFRNAALEPDATKLDEAAAAIRKALAANGHAANVPAS